MRPFSILGQVSTTSTSRVTSPFGVAMKTRGCLAGASDLGGGIEPSSRLVAPLFEHAPINSLPGFADTLSQDPRLATAIYQAFHALHEDELRIVRQSAIDTLLGSLTCHLDWRKRQAFDPRLPWVAQVARDYLHAHVYEDIGLDDLAQACGVDRFRLTRAFKAAFGLAPHAYLIQLRLAKARQLLARGESPAQVASALGFADQSHMGRWFRRAYQLTPAHYRRLCTNLPD